MDPDGIDDTEQAALEHDGYVGRTNDGDPVEEWSGGRTYNAANWEEVDEDSSYYGTKYYS